LAPCLAYSVTRKMEKILSSKTSEFLRTRRRYDTKDHSFYSHNREILISSIQSNNFRLFEVWRLYLRVGLALQQFIFICNKQTSGPMRHRIHSRHARFWQMYSCFMHIYKSSRQELTNLLHIQEKLRTSNSTWSCH
jgi:hypothetical protein